MTKNPGQLFRTDTSQKEREEVLRNDRRASTMHGRTSADLDLENIGRHAKPNTVIGTGAIEYPRLPENSWVNNPVPPEEALGFDVNQVEPQGETFEIERSLAGATADASC